MKISVIYCLIYLSIGIVPFTSFCQDFQTDTIRFNRYDVNVFHQMIGQDLFLPFYSTKDLLVRFPEEVNYKSYDSCYTSIIDATFEGLGGLNDTLFLYQCFKREQRDFYYSFHHTVKKIEPEQLSAGFTINLTTGETNKNLKITLSKIFEDKIYSQVSSNSDLAFLEPVRRDFFLGVKLYNYWVGDFVAGKDSASMILFDANGNGSYSDPQDLLSIDNYGVSGFTLMTSYINTGFVTKTRYFGIKEHRYEILEINEEQGYLVFQKTDAPPDIRVKPNVFDLLIRNGDNELITIRELADGKYLCLDFWMRYCAPCIRKFPFINEFTAKNTSNIKVVGVLENSTIQELTELREYFKLQFDQALSSETLKNTFQVAGFPHVVLIDPEGYIVTTRFNLDSLYNRIE